MSIVNGNKITTLIVSAANGDTYGDAERALFRGIQALVMPNVKNMTTTSPPLSPVLGDTYVVATGGTGSWSGKDNQIACWAIDSQDGTVNNGLWEFYVPQNGWIIYDQLTNFSYLYNGTTWVNFVLNQVTKTPVTAAATTTLTTSTSSSFRVAVGTAVTSIVFTNGAVDGEEITVLWVQDGTGHSVTGPAGNIHGFTAPSTTASSVSCQTFTWDATLAVWYATSAGSISM